MRIHHYNNAGDTHVFYKPTDIHDGDYYVHNDVVYLCRVVIDNNSSVIVEFVKLIPDERRQRTIVPEPQFHHRPVDDSAHPLASDRWSGDGMGTTVDRRTGGNPVVAGNTPPITPPLKTFDDAVFK